MSEIMDDIAYLSQEIGPRPAGTEEEQQSALYIAERVQKRSGLSTTIEDFSCMANPDTPEVICFAVAAIAAIVSMFFPVVGLPAFLVVVICAFLLGSEIFGRPVLSRVLSRGVSQNVVAKYTPSGKTASHRSRKVIVVAGYDSGRVRRELSRGTVGVYGYLKKASAIALAVLAVLLLFRAVVFPYANGGLAMVLNVIEIIAVVLCILPVIIAFLHRTSVYNEAANGNAAGVAAMMELADRVGSGRLSPAELAELSEAAQIHGEEAAREAGVVPDGAELGYENADASDDGLSGALAAVAALTGRPVRTSYVADDATPAPTAEPAFREPDEEAVARMRTETRDALTGAAAKSAPEEEKPATDDVPAEAATDEASDRAAGTDGPTPGERAADEAGTSPVPDWFKAAREKAAAKTGEKAETKVARSRYADALDAAVGASNTHFEEANRAVDARADERRWNLRDIDADAEGTTATKAPEAPASPEPAAEKPSETVMTPKNDDPADTAPLPLVEDEREPVFDTPAPARFARDIPAASPSETTEIPPIDVSSLRAKAAKLREDTARKLQAKPSRDIRPAEHAEARRLVDAAESAPVVDLPPVVEAAQAAPIVADEERPDVTPRSGLSARIPTIDGAASTGADREAPAPMDNKAAALRSSLPSLSAPMPAVEAEEPKDKAPSAVSLTGSFAAIGATGTFAPVGDELVADVDPEDRYIEDADDSGFEETTTMTGAYAGPGYVEMPKSRVRKLFGRFGHKKNEPEVSTGDWLDVDESFDAQTVGAQRGGWESFRDEDGADAAEPRPRESSAWDDDEDDTWQGGAFSKLRSRVGRSGGRGGDAGVDDYDDYADYDEPSFVTEADGGGDDERTSDDAVVTDRSTARRRTAAAAPDGVDAEIEQVYGFRNPDVDVEVWFVALGAQQAGNGGLNAFLKEHKDDLRGAMFLDLEGLGAGDLTYIESEGAYRPKVASSRMKRFIRKAEQASGMKTGTGAIDWRDGTVTAAMAGGHQAMGLMGMDGKKPAYFAQGDDVIENIDEKTLMENIDFAMNLLKNV